MADTQHLASLGAQRSPVLASNLHLQQILELIQEQVTEQKRTNALIQDLLVVLKRQ